MLGRPWVPFFLLVDHVVIVSQAKISFSFIRTPLSLRWRSLPHWSARLMTSVAYIVITEACEPVCECVVTP